MHAHFCVCACMQQLYIYVIVCMYMSCVLVYVLIYVCKSTLVVICMCVCMCAHTHMHVLGLFMNILHVALQFRAIHMVEESSTLVGNRSASGLQVTGNAFPVQLLAGPDPHLKQYSLTGFWPFHCTPLNSVGTLSCPGRVFNAPGGLEAALCGLGRR